MHQNLPSPWFFFTTRVLETGESCRWSRGSADRWCGVKGSDCSWLCRISPFWWFVQVLTLTHLSTHRWWMRLAILCCWNNLCCCYLLMTDLISCSAPEFWTKESSFTWLHNKTPALSCKPRVSVSLIAFGRKEKRLGRVASEHVRGRKLKRGKRVPGDRAEWRRRVPEQRARR